MSAYFIVDIDIHNEPGIIEYRNQVPATIAKYGGRIVVRGATFEVLEGDWQPKRTPGQSWHLPAPLDRRLARVATLTALRGR